MLSTLPFGPLGVCGGDSLQAMFSVASWDGFTTFHDDDDDDVVVVVVVVVVVIIVVKLAATLSLENNCRPSRGFHP